MMLQKVQRRKFILCKEKRAGSGEPIKLLAILFNRVKINLKFL